MNINLDDIARDLAASTGMPLEDAARLVAVEAAKLYVATGPEAEKGARLVDANAALAKRGVSLRLK